MLKNLSILILFIFFAEKFIYAQNLNVDSLENLLKNYSDIDTNQADLLIEISYEIYECQTNKAIDYAKEALFISQQLEYKVGIAESYRLLGLCNRINLEFEKSFDYFNKSIEKYQEIKDTAGITRCLNNLGFLFENQGNYMKSLEYYEQSLELAEQTNDFLLYSMNINNIGIIYEYRDDYPTALEYYQKALKLGEEIDNQKIISRALNNIGNIYLTQNEFDMALECYNNSLEIAESINDSIGITNCYTNLGIVLFYKEDFDKAIEYTYTSKEISEKINDKAGVARCYLNIGYIFESIEKYEKAIENYLESNKIYEEIGDSSNICLNWINLGIVYMLKKDYQTAIDFSLKALDIANQKQLIQTQRIVHENLAEIYEINGDYKNSLKHFKKYKILNDSLFNEEKIKKLTALEYTYKFEKEKHETEIEQQKKDAIQQADRRLNLFIIYSLLTAFLVMIIIAGIIYYFYIQKKKINNLLAKQKIDIEQKNEELELQKQLIEEAHYQITASVNYSKSIQNAVLPKNSEIKKILPNSFIFFQACNIVSGDFYFVKKIKHFKFFAAADCTGHGVPGAFLSMLGITLLNEILRSEITNSAMILNELRSLSKNILQQTGTVGEKQEGMDIAFCTINHDTLEMSFAGAYNPCWIFRIKLPESSKLSGSYEQIILEADRQPVGIYFNEKPFSEHKFQLMENDIIYIFSDGYYSQFGGEKNEKFKRFRFQDLLKSVCYLPVDKQKQIVENKFNEWKGNREQTDDVLVISVKI